MRYTAASGEDWVAGGGTGRDLVLAVGLRLGESILDSMDNMRQIAGRSRARNNVCRQSRARWVAGEKESPDRIKIQEARTGRCHELIEDPLASAPQIVGAFVQCGFQQRNRPGSDPVLRLARRWWRQKETVVSRTAASRPGIVPPQELGTSKSTTLVGSPRTRLGDSVQ